MIRRLEKWKKTLNSDAQKKAFDNQKDSMVKSETKHTKELVYIEEAIKRVADGQSVIHLPYYIIFGKELYSKLLKFVAQTLLDEVCILEKKWETRGLDLPTLQAVEYLLIPNFVPCKIIPDYIPKDARLFWPDTNASIPTDWLRDTDFDLKFLEGAASGNDPGANGGNVDHIHVVDTHIHTQNHAHKLNARGGLITTDTATVPGIPTPTTFAASSHVHAVKDSESNTDSTTAGTSTITAKIADPLSRKAILIKPADATQEIPDNCLLLYDDSVVPAGLFVADGNNGTDDFDDRFIAIPDVGADGGGAIGATTHTHIVGANHGHTLDHKHNDSDFGNTSATVFRAPGAFGLGTEGIIGHHKATRIQGTSPAIGTTSEAWQNEDTAPAYKKLVAIQNESGGILGLGPKMILPYVGTIASIPSKWDLCDGTNGTPDMRDKQVMCTKDGVEYGNIGGSNSHTHLGTAHNHSVAAHTHPYTFTTIGYSGTGGLSSIAKSTHNHTNSMTTWSGNVNNQTSTLQSTDGRRPWRTILFVMYNP